MRFSEFIGLSFAKEKKLSPNRIWRKIVLCICIANNKKAIHNIVERKKQLIAVLAWYPPLYFLIVKNGIRIKPPCNPYPKIQYIPIIMNKGNDVVINIQTAYL